MPGSRPHTSPGSVSSGSVKMVPPSASASSPATHVCRQKKRKQSNKPPPPPPQQQQQQRSKHPQHRPGALASPVSSCDKAFTPARPASSTAPRKQMESGNEETARSSFPPQEASLATSPTPAPRAANAFLITPSAPQGKKRRDKDVRKQTGATRAHVNGNRITKHRQQGTKQQRGATVPEVPKATKGERKHRSAAGAAERPEGGAARARNKEEEIASHATALMLDTSVEEAAARDKNEGEEETPAPPHAASAHVSGDSRTRNNSSKAKRTSVEDGRSRHRRRVSPAHSANSVSHSSSASTATNDLEEEAAPATERKHEEEKRSAFVAPTQDKEESRPQQPTGERQAAAAVSEHRALFISNTTPPPDPCVVKAVLATAAAAHPEKMNKGAPVSHGEPPASSATTSPGMLAQMTDADLQLSSRGLRFEAAPFCPCDIGGIFAFPSVGGDVTDSSNAATGATAATATAESSLSPWTSAFASHTHLYDSTPAPHNLALVRRHTASFLADVLPMAPRARSAEPATIGSEKAVSGGVGNVTHVIPATAAVTPAVIITSTIANESRRESSTSTAVAVAADTAKESTAEHEASETVEAHAESQPESVAMRTASIMHGSTATEAIPVASPPPPVPLGSLRNAHNHLPEQSPPIPQSHVSPASLLNASAVVTSTRSEGSPRPSSFPSVALDGAIPTWASITNTTHSSPLSSVMRDGEERSSERLGGGEALTPPLLCSPAVAEVTKTATATTSASSAMTDKQTETAGAAASVEVHAIAIPSPSSALARPATAPAMRRSALTVTNTATGALISPFSISSPYNASPGIWVGSGSDGATTPSHHLSPFLYGTHPNDANSVRHNSTSNNSGSFVHVSPVPRSAEGVSNAASWEFPTMPFPVPLPQHPCSGHPQQQQQQQQQQHEQSTAGLADNTNAVLTRALPTNTPSNNNGVATPGRSDGSPMPVYHSDGSSTTGSPQLSLQGSPSMLLGSGHGFASAHSVSGSNGGGTATTTAAAGPAVSSALTTPCGAAAAAGVNAGTASISSSSFVHHPSFLSGAQGENDFDRVRHNRVAVSDTVAKSETRLVDTLFADADVIEDDESEIGADDRLCSASNGSQGGGGGGGGEWWPLTHSPLHGLGNGAAGVSSPTMGWEGVLPAQNFAGGYWNRTGSSAEFHGRPPGTNTGAGGGASSNVGWQQHQQQSRSRFSPDRQMHRAVSASCASVASSTMSLLDPKQPAGGDYETGAAYDLAVDEEEWEMNSSAYADSLDEAQIQWIEEQLKATENPEGFF